MTQSDYDLIQKYLNGNLDIYAVVPVFSKYSSKRHFAKNVMFRQTDRMAEMLKYELKKIIHASEKTNPTLRSRESKSNSITSGISEHVQGSVDSTTQDHRGTTDRIYLDDIDSVIDSDLSDLAREKIERAKLYRERGHFHGRLHEAVSDEVRFTICEQLYLIQFDIDSSNRRIKELEAGVPTEKLTPKKARTDFTKTKENLQSYVRRYRKKVKEAPTEELKERYQTMLDEYTSELQKITGA